MCILCIEVKLQVELAADLAGWRSCSLLCALRTFRLSGNRWMEDVLCASAVPAAHVKILAKREVGIENCFMLEVGGGTWEIRSRFEQWVGAWLDSAGEVMPAKSAGCGCYRLEAPLPILKIGQKSNDFLRFSARSGSSVFNLMFVKHCGKQCWCTSLDLSACQYGGAMCLCRSSRVMGAKLQVFGFARCNESWSRDVTGRGIACQGQLYSHVWYSGEAGMRVSVLNLHRLGQSGMHRNEFQGHEMLTKVEAEVDVEVGAWM